MKSFKNKIRRLKTKNKKKAIYLKYNYDMIRKKIKMRFECQTIKKKLKK